MDVYGYLNGCENSDNHLTRLSGKDHQSYFAILTKEDYTADALMNCSSVA